MNKYFYTGLVLSAIAFNSTTVNAQESYQENNPETVFVCNTESNTPTMFAYTPGKVALTPLISWYPEYLLPEQSAAEVCEQVASKLQNFAQQQQANYLVAESKENHTLVCMVNQETDNCSSQTSEPLFSINRDYHPSCILDQTDPLECMATGKVRGVFSIDDEPIKPIWWFW